MAWKVFNVQSSLFSGEAAHAVEAVRADEPGGDVPGSPQTTAVLAIGATVTGTCGRVDRDWYQVQLVAGETYVFETSASSADPFFTADFQLVLRRPLMVGPQTVGDIVASDDDSGPGLNALLTFTAPTSGLYWIDIGASNGAALGYSLRARTTAASDPVPGNASTSSALAVGGALTGAIDHPHDTDWHRVTLEAWQSYLFSMTGDGAGALVDPFVRLFDSAGALVTYNDDGGEGRDAALRFTPTRGGTYYISAEGWEDEAGDYRLSLQAVPAQDPLATIDWGTKLADPAVQVYFAPGGGTYGGYSGLVAWTESEIAAAMAACASLAAVCNVTFTQVTDLAAATLVMIKTPLEDASAEATPPPNFPATAAFDPFVSVWPDNQPGGYTFATMVHEIGHVLGLSHPHDDSGTSEVMEGVADEFDFYGSALLNQGAFTVMSYNDGWPLGPNGYSYGDDWGASSGPMALDIAVLQRKYGATANRPGDDVYALPHPVDAGAGLLAIWDTGGVDTLRLAGAQGAVIDLRPATLLNAEGGGGYVSYIHGLAGGFTIAAGVAIENGEGGDHDDILTGNAFANRLSGAGGKDRLTGGGGDDRLDGGGGEWDAAVYAGAAFEYGLTLGQDGDWRVQDLRNGAADGLDTLHDIELIRFSDQTRLGAATTDAVRLHVAFDNILRADPAGESATFLNGLVLDVATPLADSVAKIVQRADATTSVASLSYQFFTGKVPTGAGFDYLVDPAGPNANTLSSAYYQLFNLENRYINFAVNLGKLGEGRTAFELAYGNKTLFEATKLAYAAIFGATPSDAKVADLVPQARADYFAAYGGDGLTGIGTKAAMVGWLLAEAVKADIGMYASANTAFLTDLADGADFHVDLIGVYGRAEYVYSG